MYDQLFRPDDKGQAEAARDYWRSVKRHGIYSAGLLGTLTSAGIVFAPLPAAACLATAWFAETKFDALETLAADPTRFDYDSRTEAGVVPFYAEVLGASELELGLAEVGEVTLNAASRIRALVRAVERAQGAARRERPDALDRQLRAARDHRGRAVELLAQTHERTARLTEQFRIVNGDLPFRESDARGRVMRARIDELLPAESLVLAYRLGVPLRLAREYAVNRPPANPLEELAAAIDRAAAASTALGRLLSTLELEAPDATT